MEFGIVALRKNIGHWTGYKEAVTAESKEKSLFIPGIRMQWISKWLSVTLRIATTEHTVCTDTQACSYRPVQTNMASFHRSGILYVAYCMECFSGW